jgi:hypothetical protein
MNIRNLVAGVVLLISLNAVRAQNYAIDWFTIDGGGGTSTGGVFSVSGTIGQPDAGVMSGGNFTIQGGFWGGIVAVQTEDGPRLLIENLLNGTARITWAPNTPGFVLQQVTALTPMPVSTGWSNAPAGYTNGVIVPASQQMRYFRLFKP